MEGHQWTLYDEVIRIPILIKRPFEPHPGRVVAAERVTLISSKAGWSRWAARHSAGPAPAPRYDTMKPPRTRRTFARAPRFSAIHSRAFLETAVSRKGAVGTDVR